MSDVLDLLIVRPGVCYAVRGGLFLLFYRDSPTLEDLEAREPLLARLSSNNPDGGVFLSLIDTSIAKALPDTAARAETARQLEAYKGSVKGGAVVLSGSGIRTTLARSMLRSLLILRGGPVPMRFFSTVNQAAGWCLERLDVPLGERGKRTQVILGDIARMKEEAGWPERTSTPPT